MQFRDALEVSEEISSRKRGGETQKREKQRKNKARKFSVVNAEVNE